MTHSTFLPTRWTLILAAQKSPSPASRDALEQLARAYWYPLYAYIRRHGHDAQPAEDLTQTFFAQLLERQLLAGVDPAKGRFRAFLLACVKHFLAHAREHDRAQKRGGAQRILSLDAAESRFAREPATHLTAEKLFERQWALTLLDHVLQKLEADYRTRGEAPLFETLKHTLTAATPAPSYADLAQTLQTTEGAVKTAIHRLRRRYRDLLREEIAHTVATPEEVEAEIAYLLNCL